MYTHLLQKKLPHKTINNFTSDWNDGTLVAALVDAMAPGLCPENEDMDPANALHNASHAMKLAEDWLEVPQVSERDQHFVLLLFLTKSAQHNIIIIIFVGNYQASKVFVIAGNESGVDHHRVG